MKKNLIYLIALLAFCHLANREFQGYSRPWRMNFSRKIKTSFADKKEFYFYRSLITGRKRGVSKELKEQFKSLNLLHLLTPSGLHYSAIFFFFVFLARKFNNPWVGRVELLMALSIYFFLPGYYSFRRIALLRSLFILRKQRKSRMTPWQIFCLFLLIDALFGTLQASVFSFVFSCAFIAIIIANKSKSNYSIYLSLFFMQILIAYAFDNTMMKASLILSPVLTWLFTMLFPLLCINIPLLSELNFSQYLIRFFISCVEYSFQLGNIFGSFKVNAVLIIAILIANKKTSLLSTALFMIGLVV